MRERPRAVVAIAVVLAASLPFAGARPALAAAPKVTIIVGPSGAVTSQYRSMADEVATAATAAGATVAKVYSPNATWANVKTAVNAANVIVYFGHGNGYPNPYGDTELTDRTNGWGLNRKTTGGDADNWQTTMVYCGERVLLGQLTSSDDSARLTYCGGTANDGITPAAGFTMVYAQAHYAPGFGERYVTSDPLTTRTEAQQRVRNYSMPVLRLGGTYFATAYGDADEIVARVLTERTTSFGQIFSQGRGYSPSTLTDMAHPDVAGTRVWVQRTTISGMHFGDPDYWYALAGVPTRTPAGGTAPAPTPAPSTGPQMQRIAGADRYATAAAISASSFAPGVAVAYVATGANFPDALSAGAAASRRDAPILLVTSSNVPAATATELGRLRPATIKVVGGSGVISDSVVITLRGYATTGAVQRLAGPNRYATAGRVSADTFSPGVPVAYVATGANFPDALAGVAAAGSTGGPILLVAPSEIPWETASELARLRPGRIVVLGGSGVISDGVAAQLAGYATSGVVTRLAGVNRYATAVAISAGTFAAGPTVFVATGTNFPDALGGGPIAGGLPAPLLLVPTSGVVPTVVAAELRRIGPDTVVILGGTGSVSNDVAFQIESILSN